MFVVTSWQLYALREDDGSIDWMFRSTTGEVFDMRLIDDRLVIWTARHQPGGTGGRIATEVTLDATTGDVLEQHDVTSRTMPYERGGVRIEREIRIGDTGRSYFVVEDGTVVLWSGTEVVRRIGTRVSDWYATSPDGNLLYGSGGGLGDATVCYDVATRGERWRADGHSLVGLVQAGDTLYGTAPGYGPITALDTRTGEFKWRFPQGANQGRSPVVVGSVVYAGSWHGGLWVVTAERGELLWHIRARESGRIWTPGVADGVVYYVADDGYCYAIENMVAR